MRYTRLSICGKLSLNASIASEARDYSVMDHTQHLRTIHREYAIDIEAPARCIFIDTNRILSRRRASSKSCYLTLTH